MNALEELKSKLKELNTKMVWADIQRTDWQSYYDSPSEIPGDFTSRHILFPDHTPEELESFLQSLNFEYDNGYGTAEIYGYVGLSDGSWLERHEYDGSEYWVHPELPTPPSRTPKELKE